MKLVLALAAGAAVGAVVVRKLAQDPQVRDAVADFKVQAQAVLVDVIDELAKVKDKAADAAQTAKDKATEAGKNATA